MFKLFVPNYYKNIIEISLYVKNIFLKEEEGGVGREKVKEGEIKTEGN